MSAHIVAIDQGTTSTRSIVFNQHIEPVATVQKEFKQYFPKSGWVEHDPQDLWQSSLQTLAQAVEKANLTVKDIAAIGITNQRETIVVWERETGQPICPAIVWQDRRTTDYCHYLVAEGNEPAVQQATGLLIDPYFSASKLRWILDNVAGAKQKARNGELLFGTVDSWLIWNLTGQRAHVTDATNAARTQLYNIHQGEWDKSMLNLFGIPESMLPSVLNCADKFGVTDASLVGAGIPILGVAGDQQAALIGQACFKPGMLKSTYGTGCFAVMNTGQEAVQSDHRLLTTIAYQLDGQVTYALEGSIFIAGAAVQWLRDGLHLFSQAQDSQALAEKADDGHHVYLVPAFVGLGAPYWDADARGALFGLTRNSSPADFARAALESVGYQTRDLLQAMRKDWQGARESVLRVDGGMTASDWTMQFLADILNSPVDRPKLLETTALGAAYLAGFKQGLYPGLVEFSQSWALEKTFDPMMPHETREQLYAGWKDVLQRTLNLD